jgi:hypothetical protein
MGDGTDSWIALRVSTAGRGKNASADDEDQQETSATLLSQSAYHH